MWVQTQNPCVLFLCPLFMSPPNSVSTLNVINMLFHSLLAKMLNKTGLDTEACHSPLDTLLFIALAAFAQFSIHVTVPAELILEVIL